MKVQKSITIDYDIFIALRNEKNISELINGFLKNYLQEKEDQNGESTA